MFVCVCVCVCEGVCVCVFVCVYVCVCEGVCVYSLHSYLLDLYWMTFSCLCIINRHCLHLCSLEQRKVHE